MGLVLALMSFEKSYAQIETNLIGEYTAVSGTEIETIEIFKDKVEAKIGGEVVEKYFFYKKEGETYILEYVKPDVESVDFSEKKDRHLVKVQLQETDTNTISFDFILPNGAKKKIVMSKAQ